jgi:hypothetical protein
MCGQALAAAYRSGYEGQSGHVVDDAVQGDPRADSSWAPPEGDARDELSSRARDQERRPRDGHDSETRAERRETRGPDRRAAREESRRGRDGGDEAAPGARDSGDRGARFESDQGRDREERGERNEVRREPRPRGRQGARRRESGEREEGGRDGGNVPTDDYRRMHEQRAREKLDHDLERDTGRGPFKRMKNTLQGMSKAAPSDNKPEPPHYKESDDWNHFWGSAR